MPDAPPSILRAPVSNAYNLALQQARIEALPEDMRLRLGKLLLKGWVFTLVGSELNKHDQFDDSWALSLPDHPWPALNTLDEQIRTAEGAEKLVEKLRGRK